MATRKSSTPTFDASMRIIVLHGKEQYLLDSYTRQIIDALDAEHAPGEGESIQRFEFDGGSCTAADVLDELRSYSLMQTYKLVVLDNAGEFFKKKDDDGAKPSDNRRIMERYAEAPVDSATLLIRSDTWRPGKIDKLIKKNGHVVKCESPNAGEATRWAQGRCEKRYGVKIDREAAALLVERLGTSLTRLDSELNKLAAFAAAAGRIDRAAVIEMVGLGREEKAWELQVPILQGRPGDAIRKLRELREISQVDGVLVVWAIADMLRKLHTAGRMLSDGKSPGTVASEIRLWGEGKALFLDAARRLEPGRFADLLNRTLETVRGLRSNLGSEDRSLEALTALVADTIGSGTPSSARW